MKTSRKISHYKVGKYECSVKPNNGKKYKFQVDFNNNVPPLTDPRPSTEGKPLKRRTTFETRAEAEDFIILLQTELEHGATLNLAGDERMDFVEARKLLKDAGRESERLQDIVKDWLSYQTSGSDDTVEKVWNKWYEIRSKKDVPSTLGDHRYTRDHALKPFFNLPISEFNKPMYRIALANRLNERWTDRQTLKNQRKGVNLFFKYAWKQDFVNAIPLSGKYEFDLPETKGDGEKEPFILTVDQAESLLRIAYETDKEFGLYNFFCVGLFAGLRTTEIKNLSWNDFIMDDEDEDRIYISGKTKTGRIRQVAMTEQFKEWLSMADRTKPFIPKNFIKRRRTLLQLAGLRDGETGRTTFTPLPPEALDRVEELGLTRERDSEAIDPTNFMRHSCASYMYKSDRYTEKYITDNFGHSKTVLHGSYINRRVTKAGAKRFLDLKPSTKNEKLIKFA